MGDWGVSPIGGWGILLFHRRLGEFSPIGTGEFSPIGGWGVLSRRRLESSLAGLFLSPIHVL